MPAKQRLDQLLVDRGLAESRERARALILAGDVLVNAQKATKPGHPVAVEARVEVTARPRYVSRGGLKLEAALAHFAIDVAGKICLDVGASTGGFTDCLLQHGALRVYAFDVGHGQIDWKLRNDPRVVVREGVNARHLTAADLPEVPQVATCDVSFISATLILPALAAVTGGTGELVILVKPQFEAGRGEVGKGGIVRDAAVQEAACDRVRAAAEALGFRTGITDSPILGAEGNREFLLYAAR
jgi:23S rRNA (cytidine1920-2'-O)/16S rRNA (cytidine1409-2'-O)-methyltransferase